MPVTEGDSQQRSKKRPAGPKTYKQKKVKPAPRMVPRDDPGELQVEKALIRKAPPSRLPPSMGNVLPSGETFGAWFGRRMGMVGGPLALMPLHVRLSLAGSSLSDRTLETLSKAKVLPKDPKPTPSGSGGQFMDSRGNPRPLTRAEQIVAAANPPGGIVGFLGGVDDAVGAVASDVGKWAGRVGKGSLRFGSNALDIIDWPVKKAIGEPLSAVAQVAGGAYRAVERKLGVGGFAPFEEDGETGSYQPTSLSLSKAYANAKKMGPGAAFAVSNGVEPSDPGFGTMAIGFDLAVFSKFDLLAGAGRLNRVRKASKVTPNLAEARRYRSRVERAAARMLSKTPEQIVNSRTGEKNLRNFWDEVQKHTTDGVVNKNALLSKYPNLFDDADDLALLVDAPNFEEFKRAVTGMMHGRIPGWSRTKAATALRETEEKIVGLGKPAKDSEEAAELGFLRSRRRALQKYVSRTDNSTSIRGLPTTTWTNDLREAVRRGDGGLAVKTANWMLDSEWARKHLPAVGKLPSRGISLIDKTDGRVQLDRLGQIMGLSRRTVDDHVNRYLSATSHGEARDAVIDMIGEAGKDLPEYARAELTGIYDNPSLTVYWATKEKKPFTEWRRLNSEYDQPIFTYQRAQEIPLPDVREIVKSRQFLGRIEKKLAYAGDLSTAKGRAVARTGGLASDALSSFRALMSGFTSAVWAPLALFRLGWTIKVVGDEQLRLLAAGVYPQEYGPLAFIGRAGSMTDIPEEALASFGKMFMDIRPAKGVIGPGEKGYLEYLQNEIVALHHDKVVRHLLNNGVDNTVAWLERGTGQRHLDNMRDVLEATGSDTRKWVELQNSLLRGKYDDEFLEAIRTGKFAEVKVKDSAVKELWKRKGKSLPPVTMHGDFWQAPDASLWQRGVRAWFDFAGSKPTNYLSRGPAFQHFYSGEKRRLLSLGVSENAAEASARGFGIEQVGKILYDGAERSAWDMSLRNWAPFFPAWKEVHSRWLKEIPNTMGFGLGQAVLAAKVGRALDVANEHGAVYRDEYGKLRIGVFGKEFPLASFNMLGNFPFGGPVTGQFVANLVRDNAAWAEAFDFAYPAGYDSHLFNATLTKMWYSWTKGEKGAPPWEFWNGEVRQAQFNSAAMNYLRANKSQLDELGEKVESGEMSSEEFEAAVRELRDEAVSHAGGDNFARGAQNFIWPVAPRHYWPGEKEARAFQKTLDRLTKGERGLALREFLEENPSLEYWFVSGYLVNEKARDDAEFDFWRAFRNGEAKQLSIEDFIKFAVGEHNKGGIFEERRRKLVTELGPNAADWLKNPRRMQEIQREASEALGQLEFHNPVWSRIWNEKQKSAAKREGKPLPSFEQKRFLDFTRDWAQFQEQLNDIDPLGVQFDVAGMKKAVGELRGLLDIDSFYKDDELAPGPERELAKYFDEVYGPYWDQIASLAAPLDLKANSSKEEQDQARWEIQKFKNSVQTPLVNGVEYPTPEEVSYGYQPEERREATRVRWAASAPAFLTRFQRKTLGLRDDQEVVDFWEAVRAEEIKASAYIRDNGLTGKAKTEVNASVDAWKQDVASRFGFEEELVAAEAARYDRARARGHLPSVLERAAEQADAAWAFLLAEEKGPTSALGLQTFKKFHDWFRGVLSWDAEMVEAWEIVKASLPYQVRGRGTDSTTFGYEGPFFYFWFGGKG